MIVDPTFIPFILIGGGIIFLFIFFHYVPFFLWLSAKVSGVDISLIQLFFSSTIINDYIPQILLRCFEWIIIINPYDIGIHYKRCN